MDELHKQELLEKFLEGTLTKEEKKLFQNLQATDSSGMEEDLAFLQRFQNVQIHFGREKFKLELTSLEKELQKEEAPDWNEKLEKQLQDFGKKLHYSLQELMALFQPQPEYQAVLAFANRSEHLEIICPDNGIDASMEGLTFRIEGKFKKPLQLIIENNQRTVVLQTSVSPLQKEFSIDIEELKTGRYYWKLKGEKKTIIREFFIQKNLMPK